MAAAIMPNDLADLRLQPTFLLRGTEVVHALVKLTNLSDQLRREQLLYKFYLQLETCPYDRFPRLERPYGAQESKEFLKELAAKDECYIVVRVSNGTLEVVSDQFLRLTRFTNTDCRRAKSWRILQGRGADKAGWEELARKMANGHAPQFDLLQTSMARERSFTARIYAAPVCIY